MSASRSVTAITAHRKSRRWCCKRSKATPKPILVRPSIARSLPCPLISTTHSVTRRRTLAVSPAWTCCASSTSRPHPAWLTAWARRRTASSRFMTSAAVRSTSPFWRWAMACSKSAAPTGIPTSAATTSTSASSPGWRKNSRRKTASICGRIARRFSV